MNDLRSLEGMDMIFNARQEKKRRSFRHHPKRAKHNRSRSGSQEQTLNFKHLPIGLKRLSESIADGSSKIIPLIALPDFHFSAGDIFNINSGESVLGGGRNKHHDVDDGNHEDSFSYSCSQPIHHKNDNHNNNMQEPAPEALNARNDTDTDINNGCYAGTNHTYNLNHTHSISHSRHNSYDSRDFDDMGLTLPSPPSEDDRSKFSVPFMVDENSTVNELKMDAQVLSNMDIDIGGSAGGVGIGGSINTSNNSTDGINNGKNKNQNKNTNGILPSIGLSLINKFSSSISNSSRFSINKGKDNNGGTNKSVDLFSPDFSDIHSSNKIKNSSHNNISNKHDIQLTADNLNNMGSNSRHRIQLDEESAAIAFAQTLQRQSSIISLSMSTTRSTHDVQISIQTHNSNSNSNHHTSSSTMIIGNGRSHHSNHSNANASAMDKNDSSTNGTNSINSINSIDTVHTNSSLNSIHNHNHNQNTNTKNNYNHTPNPDHIYEDNETECENGPMDFNLRQLSSEEDGLCLVMDTLYPSTERESVARNSHDDNDDDSNHNNFASNNWASNNNDNNEQECNRNGFKVEDGNHNHDNGRSAAVNDDMVDLDLFPEEEFLIYKDPHKSAFNLGNGAFGVVQKGFHFRSCKMVALKQCRSHLPVHAQGFVTEAKLYLEFEFCPFIVDILGFGRNTTQNNDLCMALEYMSLKSLDNPKLLQIFEGNELLVSYLSNCILRALQALHGNLYVHNDIKPHNILMNQNKEIKLSDFGCVLQMADESTPLTENNGTQCYQSPEKLYRMPIRYTAKADIWSFGITIYEILFNKVNTTTKDVNYARNPPYLTAAKHKVSQDLCFFFNRCLISDPKLRPTADVLLQHPFVSKFQDVLPDDNNNIDSAHDGHNHNNNGNLEVPLLNDFTRSVSNSVFSLSLPFSHTTVCSPASLQSPYSRKANAFPSPVTTTEMKQETHHKNYKKKKNKNKNGNKNNSAVNTTQTRTRTYDDIVEHDIDIIQTKNTDHLRFMIGSLIYYYGRRQFLDEENIRRDNYSATRRRSNALSQTDLVNDNANVKTLDEERIENMSLYCGYSPPEIIQFIRSTVAVIKMRLSQVY